MSKSNLTNRLRQFKPLQRLFQFGMSYNVFISVEEHDLSYAGSIGNFLRNRGARVFVFNRSIHNGKKWREEIKRNLKDSHLFISILTPKSINATNPTLERGGAYFLDKDILQVVVGKVDKGKIGMTDELHYTKYRDSTFYPNLRKKLALYGFHEHVRSPRKCF